MYTSMNDSCLEEKLDDNHLQWEASNLEYDDDFLQAVSPADRKKKVSAVSCSIDRCIFVSSHCLLRRTFMSMDFRGINDCLLAGWLAG